LRFTVSEFVDEFTVGAVHDAERLRKSSLSQVRPRFRVPYRVLLDFRRAALWNDGRDLPKIAQRDEW